MPTENWPINLAVILGAILAVWILVGIVGWILRRVFLALEKAPALESASTGIRIVRGNIRVILFLVASLASIGIGAYGGWLWFEGEDLRAWAEARIAEIPDDFWIFLAIGVAKFVGLAIAAWFGLRLVRRTLNATCERAKAYEGVKANDESVERFFQSLGTVASRATWIAVLAYGAGFLGLPENVVEAVFLALRVYLILAVGLLVWRAIDAVIESLDALSVKYSSPTNVLRHYDSFRHLVPILRRTIEYVLIVFVVSLAVEQVDWAAEYAQLGPVLIRVIGIIFLSRVVIEILNLLIGEFMIKRAKLDPEQRKRRRTIVPLIESILKYIVYFNAAFLIVRQFGIDPTPFFAGAGIIGLAIGLGAQNLVNDMVSGFFILFEDYYLVGDFISAEGAEGTVERIDLRTTRIRDMSGRLHIVRNGQIDQIVNYSKSYTFAVVDVGIAYESDVDKAFETLENCGELLRERNKDVLEATQVCGLIAFAESELTVRTITKVKPGTHLSVERALRKMIKEMFDRDGIEIPYARRVLIMQNADGTPLDPTETNSEQTKTDESKS